MPIRMVEDEPGNNTSNNTNNRAPQKKRSFAGAGVNGLGNILGALLPILLKKPKILIPVLIIGGLVWYFFLR